MKITFKKSHGRGSSSYYVYAGKDKFGRVLKNRNGRWAPVANDNRQGPWFDTRQAAAEWLVYAQDNPGDEDAARELLFYIENDGTLYRQMTQPIQKNLINKMAGGKYSKTAALKAWENLATEGAKRYHHEFGSRGTAWHTMFPPDVRRLVATAMRDAFEEEAAEGEFDYLLYKKYQ